MLTCEAFMKQIPLGFGCRSVCIRKTLCLSRLLTVGDSGMNDWDGQLKERGNLDDRPTDEERNVPVKPATIKRVFKQFKRRPIVARLATQNGMNKQFLTRAVTHFTKQVLQDKSVSQEISPIVYKIQTGSGHVDDLWPYFLQFAKQEFPVVDRYDDLRNLSDLTVPSDWFPRAREMKRKVVYHCGPTNSGKTHQALESFSRGKSGVYCGPLRLLAHEVFERMNGMGIPCDLLTGEERRLASSDGETTASHLSCTVEMTPALQTFEVAVLDEIQMLRDQQRGWAWTRVVLGVLAEELHLCGEASAIDIIERLMEFTGDDFEVKHYERLTPLYCLKDSLHGDMKRLRPGDCLVSFSRGEIFKLRQEVEKATKRSCAVIYGGLPPATRVQQAQLFNDPKSSCDLLVASDAIGMGLNLNIKRIVFTSLTKFDGYRRQSLTPSHTKQIAGRAGRFGSQYPEGEITTLHRKDLKTLHDLLNTPVESIEEAGLMPSFEQLELFSLQLPHSTMKELLDLFSDLARLDGSYFLRDMEPMKAIAEVLEPVRMSLRNRFTFIVAPADHRDNIVLSCLLKMARQFSQQQPFAGEEVCLMVKWPLSRPSSLSELEYVESVHKVLDIYLWLSLQFSEMFPAVEEVREMQAIVEQIIMTSLTEYSRLRHTHDPVTIATTSAATPTRASLIHSLVEANRKLERGHGQTATKLLEHKLMRRHDLSTKDISALKRLWMKDVMNIIGK